jgi:hypothetical protein
MAIVKRDKTNVARRSFFISREGQAFGRCRRESLLEAIPPRKTCSFSTEDPTSTRQQPHVCLLQEEATPGWTGGSIAKHCKSLFNRVTKEGRSFFVIVRAGVPGKFNEVPQKENVVLRKMAPILSRLITVNEESYRVLEGIAMEDDNNLMGILDECELDDLSHDGTGDAGSLDGRTDPSDDYILMGILDECELDNLSHDGMGDAGSLDGSTDPSDVSLVGTAACDWQLKHSIHDIKSAMTATTGLWEEEDDDDGGVHMQEAKLLTRE